VGRESYHRKKFARNNTENLGIFLNLTHQFESANSKCIYHIYIGIAPVINEINTFNGVVQQPISELNFNYEAIVE
jgi:hypothetical protein